MQRCKEVGLSLYSGFILGLGEEVADLEEIVGVLKHFEVDGIVVNFYSYVSGVSFEAFQLTPSEVFRRLAQLRILFLNTSIILGEGKKRWLNEDFFRNVIAVVDTIYVGCFLNHSDPFWLREGEILADMGLFSSFFYFFKRHSARFFIVKNLLQ